MATRVVMLTTQGLLNTGIILLMLICFDWRIGAIGAAGTVLFLFLNSRMQRAGKSISARKVESDAQVVSETMEYIQGISEVKSYNMTGEKTEKLNQPSTGTPHQHEDGIRLHPLHDGAEQHN